MKRALVPFLFLFGGCVGTVDGPVGEAQATITQVPANVACVQVDVVGSRTVTKNVDVKPGQSSVVSLPGLPVGADSFSAVAFASPCGAIAGAVADWASDAVVANVAAGAVTKVTLSMHAVGSGSVGVDFPGDGGTPPLEGGMPLEGGVPFDGGVPVDLAHPVDLATPPDLTSPPPDLSSPAVNHGGISIQPSSHDFGTASVPPMMAPVFTFVLTGLVPNATAPTPSFTIAPTGNFSIVSNTCMGLTFGSQCGVTVQFNPLTTGLKSANLQAQKSDGTIEVWATLTGTGQ